MICLIALVVFGVLGIFSAYYRKLAKEAFDCVLRRATFRPCTSSFDQRMRAKIVGKVFVRSPQLARLISKNFEALSWLLTILMVASILGTAWGFYNYLQFGNCNGPESTGFCVFNPTSSSNIGLPIGKFGTPLPDDDPAIGPANASVTIIEFGCFRCPYTKKAEAAVKEIIRRYPDVRYVYRDFPLNTKHVGADIEAEAADCAAEQNSYWEYHDLLFENQNRTLGGEELVGLARQIGLNVEKLDECVKSRKYRGEVEKDFNDGLAVGVYGTPTFFINGEVLVGPQTVEKLASVIEARKP